jgi:hypothetical protein
VAAVEGVAEVFAESIEEPENQADHVRSRESGTQMKELATQRKMGWRPF